VSFGERRHWGALFVLSVRVSTVACGTASPIIPL